MESSSAPAGTPNVQGLSSTALTEEKKLELRMAVIAEARKLIGVPYEFGAEWTDYSKKPEALDCSEMVEGIFKISGLQMPDGAQAQFEATFHTDKPRPGDLAFFGKNKQISQIYHVGLLFDAVCIIEARGHQPESNFETAKVIIRPRVAWENYKNFLGFRSHAKLA